MDSYLAIHDRLKRELGLRKVMAVPNAKYRRHGLKSYVYLLNRFRFNPTLPGPYFQATKVHQIGLAGSHVALGGRTLMTKTLAKSVHADPLRGVNHASSGQVTAADQQNDSMYICEVEIGSPAQKLQLDFDTGSADLWVFSTTLSSDIQQNHNVFDSSKSTTFTDTSKQWEIQYGDGSTASGTVGTDLVNVGGIVVKNQSIELATSVAPQFSQGSCDGMLGLAFPTMNRITTDGQPDPQNTPLANMITQDGIPSDAGLFTSAFYSTRDKQSKSFYTFGYVDSGLVGQQTIHWTPIDSSQGFWMFPSRTTSVNGTVVTVPGNTAIADTGTSLALMSDQVCQAVYAGIPGAKYDTNQQGWTFPTSVTADQLPVFSIAVGDMQFVIQKEDFCFALVDPQNWYGGIQSRGDNPFDILGDVFLKSIYAIWDQANTRFGCVPKLEQTQNLTPPPVTPTEGSV